MHINIAALRATTQAVIAAGKEEERPHGTEVYFPCDHPYAYPVRVTVVQTKSKPCEKCGGPRTMVMTVTPSGASFGDDYQHTDTCPTLFCPHGVRYTKPVWGVDCDKCDADEAAVAAKCDELHTLVTDVIAALRLIVGGWEPAEVLYDELDGGEGSPDADDMREMLRTLDAEGGHDAVVAALPHALRARIQAALAA